jgi:hypothetical protein
MVDTGKIYRDADDLSGQAGRKKLRIRQRDRRIGDAGLPPEYVTVQLMYPVAPDEAKPRQGR